MNLPDRNDANLLQITEIGNFGEWRKNRFDVPGHFHTGIDIKRPGENYFNELIYPLAKGIVISIRSDGPYAQIIIEHNINGFQFWTLYEHIAGILFDINNEVLPDKPIARFMNRDELNKYGWQFDHLHFEIIKIKPAPLRYDPKHPKRYFTSYSLICYTIEELNHYYYNPFEFFIEWLK